MNRIGERIKKRRELLNLHLNELAKMVQISSSALSQIENSKSFPSVLTLKSIAEALHTSISELVGENETQSGKPVILKNEIKHINQNKSGTKVYLLSNQNPDKHMDTYLVQFSAESDIEGLFKNKHSQIFCHILSGEIRFELNKKSYVLQQGDNIYFNAKLSYSAVNNINDVSEMLWVQSPPSF